MKIKLGKNKKSQTFTVITIAIIILFFAGYEIYSYSVDRAPIKKRVTTMDSFLFSLETNMQREIYISGFRAIFLAQDSITKSGDYIGDVNSFVQEAFFNGTVQGNESDIMAGATYPDILQFVNSKADSLNVEIEMNNPKLQVFQQDPWNIALVFSCNLTMKDKGNLASWNKQESIKSLVSVEGFEDPVYLVNTNGKVAYIINKTLTSNLQEILANRDYTEDSDAPSFLKRMQGDLSADENGIESIVDLNELAKQGISIQQKSVVDHIYFSSENPPSYSVQGMPSWFRLDSAHIAKYNQSQS